jgi:antitoxin component YwqK of YwqJK toxin-antitoxin module
MYRYTTEDGVMCGLYEYWDHDGRMTERYTYVDGLKNGLCEKWYNRRFQKISDKSERLYRNGLKHGLARWYSSGRLIEIQNYKDGREDGLHKSWNENGNIEILSNYKDGRLHGQYMKYHKNGVLMEEQHWFHGVPCGSWISWYNNGKINTQSTYEYGGLTQHVLFDESGRIQRRVLYRGDQIVSVFNAPSVESVNPRKRSQPPIGKVSKKRKTK